eukprot:975158-Prorocentrum_minimum.AAC.1
MREKRQSLELIFELFDKGGKGTISLDNCRWLIKRMLPNFSQHEVSTPEGGQFASGGGQFTSGGGQCKCAAVKTAH